jgi:hypothetical protein
MSNHRILPLIIFSLVSMTLSGCSVVMASRAPEKRDLSVLSPGSSRSRVVAELGAPTESRQTQAGQVDLYAFKQGYTTSSRVTRAVTWGLMDLVTTGLWEIAGTPLESSLQGEQVQAEVTYDQDERIRRIEYFAGAHLATGGPTLATWMRGKNVRQTAVIGDAPQSPALESREILPASASSEGTGRE